MVVALGLFLFLSDKEVVVVENEIMEHTTWNMKKNAVGEELSRKEKEEAAKSQEEGMNDQDVEPEEQDELEKEEENDEKKPASDESADEVKEDDGDELRIKNKLVSWGHTKSSGRKIDAIIVHSSYNALGGDEYDVDLLIDEYEEYNVSPHYLIDRKGKIYRLVKDKDIAWHAGVSKMPDGREGANAFSIGVEMINNKEDEYTKSQYGALNSLIDSLEKKYKIKYILGHDEIAPGRKTDPWNFDWDKVDR